jgi:hypothetical protein
MIADIENICLSGGAEGADLQFGMCAGMAGQAVRHFSFAGHRSLAPADEVVVLTPEQLAIADPFLQVANRTLGRRWPVKSDFVSNLLRRNYYQVAWADAVYAVASIKNGLVTGGTSWAVQMFIDRHEGEECPAFVFDQQTNRWNVWIKAWAEIHEPPPMPTGVWAGIGSRELTLDGKKAIRDLLGYVPPASV